MINGFEKIYPCCCVNPLLFHSGHVANKKNLFAFNRVIFDAFLDCPHHLLCAQYLKYLNERRSKVFVNDLSIVLRLVVNPVDYFFWLLCWNILLNGARLPIFLHLLNLFLVCHDVVDQTVEAGSIFFGNNELLVIISIDYMFEYILLLRIFNDSFYLKLLVNH